MRSSELWPVLEQLHRTDLPDRAWAIEVALGLLRLRRGKLGVCSYFYRETERARFVCDKLQTGSDFGPDPNDYNAEMAPEVGRAVYMSGPIGDMGAKFLRNERGRLPDVAEEDMFRTGMVDWMCFVAPAGRGGLAVVVPACRDDGAPSGRDAESIRALASQMQASLRLRARLSELDHCERAVLSADGDCLHAEGTLREPSARERLRKHVRAREAARDAVRRSGDPSALDLWTTVLDGEWSFVDSYDEAGRRRVIVLRNKPEVRGLRALGPVERRVVEAAAAGEPNKVIAFELGVAEATAAVVLSTALRKMGIPDRMSLIRLFSATRPPLGHAAEAADWPAPPGDTGTATPDAVDGLL